jgi:hypothetical protein
MVFTMRMKWASIVAPNATAAYARARGVRQEIRSSRAERSCCASTGPAVAVLACCWAEPDQFVNVSSGSFTFGMRTSQPIRAIGF